MDKVKIKQSILKEISKTEAKIEQYKEMKKVETESIEGMCPINQKTKFQ